MPSIKVKVDHSLTQEEALKRIKKIFDKLKDDFKDKISDVQENWNNNSSDFSFKIMGLLMKGKLSVSTSDVFLDGSIPFTALPFKGLIESKIREEAENLLAQE
jgi:hypothetical protein